MSMRDAITRQKMYFCKLINNNRRVQESFWHAGDSKEDVLKDLKSFDWPSGRWEITDPDEDNEEMED
jgi:hypothetical protein